MTNIIVRSDEINAAATALVLAAANNTVVLRGQTLKPGEHSFRYISEERRVRLRDELDHAAPTVGMVFAEGENVPAGISDVLTFASPDLLVIVGGGITAAVEATEAAKAHNFDANKILHVGGFIVGGNATHVKSEKRNVMAGFLESGTATEVVELAQKTLPQIALGDGPTVALSSSNAFLHLPPMILNAMSVERGDDLRFYVEGFGDSVCRLLEALDKERLTLGKALGINLAPIPELMDKSREPGGMPGETFREKINTFPAYQGIKLPSSFHHRFLQHELRSTFAPMQGIAKALGVETPTIQSVVRIGEVLADCDLISNGEEAGQKFLRLLLKNTRVVN